MGSFRLILTRHRSLALAVMAFAMAMRLLVPAGFMPASEQGRLVIAVCTGTGPATMVVDLRSDHGKKHDDGKHRQADGPCAFSGLSAPALAGADPVVLLLALLFAFAAALRLASRTPTSDDRHLRPPL